MSATYVTKVNGNFIAASEVVPNSPLETRLNGMINGAFEVVSLTTGANPVPDVSNPSTKVIYLTKDSGSSEKDPYTEWICTNTTGPVWEIIGETSVDLSNYKTKQTAYTASGLGTLKTITALTQNANGEISATASDIQSASTSQKGVVQLAGSIGSSVATENNKAATEKAVRDSLNTMVSDVFYEQNTSSIKKTVGGTSTEIVSAATLKGAMNLGTAAEKDVPVSGDASSTEVVMGNDSRLGKADSAIQGVKLAGASSALIPDSNKVVTIPNAVATGETGATNGLMTAADKASLDAMPSQIEDLSNSVPVIFEVTRNTSTSVITSDTTYDDVEDAYDSGKMIYIKENLNTTTDVHIYRLDRNNLDTDNFVFVSDGGQVHDGAKPDNVFLLNDIPSKEYYVLWKRDNRWQHYFERPYAYTGINGVKITRYEWGAAAVEIDPTTIPIATTESAGAMSSTDKTKLDSLQEITVTSTSVSDGTNTFNKYTHPTEAGYKHVPSGGSSGQVLVYGGSSGTASWGAVPGLSNKADKVSSATSGDFAALDANGNLTDSGKKSSDFATAAQGTKADSAIQGIKCNTDAALTPDSNKIVTIPVAATSTYGVVTIETATI